MSEGPTDAEARRLEEDAGRLKNWKRWGPYLSERQWATVREDYSAGRKPVGELPPTSIRWRAPIAGAKTGCSASPIASAACASGWPLWNGKDPHLKERLFGLTNPEGNHSEDVKEVYFYLDATPTYSYFKAPLQVPAGRLPLRGGCARRAAAAV